MKKQKKQLVYIVAINFSPGIHSVKSWEYWCKKNNCDFYLIDTQKNSEWAPQWERYRIFDIKPDYDDYLYADSDAIVKWDAPNFFDKLSSNYLHAVVDNASLEWTVNSIKGYQDFFPETHFNWWDYFTTGFLRFSHIHKPLFKEFIHFYEKNLTEINNRQYHTLKKGFDQTPFNYMTRFMGYNVNKLPIVYSLGHLIKKDIFYNGMFLDLGYIWQFNGMDVSEREHHMKKIWDHIRYMYQ